MSSTLLSPSTEVTTPRDELASPSFLGLVATQFLGTINDNMYRWLAVGLASVVMARTLPGGDTAANRAAVVPLLLSLGLVAMTLPYILLANYAGWLADRFSKRTIIVGCKVIEIAVALLGAYAIFAESVPAMFIMIFCLGAQSALYAPAKSGAIPEMVPPERLSLANGLLGLGTITAAAIGTVLGYQLFATVKPLDYGQPAHNHWIPAMALVGVAVVGTLTSLLIRPLPTPAVKLAFPANPFQGFGQQFRQLFASPAIRRTSIGVAIFWSLAGLANLNIPVYAESLHLSSETSKSLLLAMLVVGVGIGSVLAGIWSRGKVELGIVPVGAAGIVVSLLGLFITGAGPIWKAPGSTTETVPVVAIDATAQATAPGSTPSQIQDLKSEIEPAESATAFVITTFWLLLLGISAGLYDIPLEAYLQERSPPESRGSILAATNLLVFSSTIACSIVFWLFVSVIGLAPRTMFLLAALATIPGVWYVFFLLPGATIRFVVWLSSLLVYRVRVYGEEYFPKEGGALLVSNHVTWVDGILLLMMSPRPIRMVAHADNVTKGFVGWLANTFGVIPINSSDGPKALVRSLQTAKQAVQNGELVCIFAEGALTRIGQLLPFQRGMMKIIDGTTAPVLPVYLDGLWGSIFSFRGGKFFWKWPQALPYPISIVYGPPLTGVRDVNDVRQAVQNLGAQAVEYRKPHAMTLPRLFLRKCKRAMFSMKIADSMGGPDITGGQLLMRSLIARRIFSRAIAADEAMVGVLLPPSVGGVIANTALALMRRTAVNLNYTMASDVVQNCIDQCQIRHVLTSRKFMEKVKLDLKTEYIYLEDLKDKVGLADKLITAVQAYATPSIILERVLGLMQIQHDDLATIIFTSGSTGEPKGVMLTMSNVGSNIEAIDHVINLKPTDTLLGVLPFFHSFGFTTTMWAPLTLDARGVYHYNPLDARQIGSLCQKHNVTILMTTPTFLRTYLKRCEPENFKSLNLVIVGAEKMPLDLAQAFEDKFKVRPIEGYGTTELSPLASVNVPDHRASGWMQRGTKEGSVGRPIPNTTARIVDPDTFAELPVDTAGLLLIKGPNVMKGYLNKPELTAKAIKDGWYVTGDIAKLDNEGFIHITGRQSRFSKIGGEMVPHILVEETLNRILCNGQEDGELRAVITSVPDEKKGERLIVVHKSLPKSVDEILSAMGTAGLPNLWVPSKDSFMEVEEIPVLGTGKLDLKRLQSVALEKFSATSVAST